MSDQSESRCVLVNCRPGLVGGEFLDEFLGPLAHRAVVSVRFRPCHRSIFCNAFNLMPCLSLHISHGISDFQKLSLTLDPNHLLIPCHPVPREGALAIVTDVGAGSGGRRCAFDERRVRRTAKSCGPDAPMAGVKLLRSSRFLRVTVTNKLWSRRGEHEDKS